MTKVETLTILRSLGKRREEKQRKRHPLSLTSPILIFSEVVLESSKFLKRKFTYS